MLERTYLKQEKKDCSPLGYLIFQNLEDHGILVGWKYLHSIAFENYTPSKSLQALFFPRHSVKPYFGIFYVSEPQASLRVVVFLSYR